jgi:hypothetical protein
VNQSGQRGAKLRESLDDGTAAEIHHDALLSEKGHECRDDRHVTRPPRDYMKGELLITN